MKKLMIAAAVVCAAAFAQAAAFTWTSSGKVYFDNSDPTGWKDGDVLTALTSGTKGYVDGLTGFTWAYTMALTDGSSSDSFSGTPTFSAHKISNNLSSEIFELPADDSGKTYTWDIVITGTGKVGDNDVTLTSNTIHGEQTYSKLSAEKITFASPTTWAVSMAGTPEPTSAMLLLLGMAGLALRRRRA